MTQHETAAGFSTLLETMAQMDFFSLVLPFVLSYTVFFMALKQVPLFKEEDNQKMSSLIAVIASFFVAQFIAVNPWYQTFFVEYFGSLTIGMVGILGLLIVLGLFNWDLDIFRRPWMALVFISIAGAAFVRAGGFGPSRVDSVPGISEGLNLGSLLIDTGLIWILVIGGVIVWLSSDDEDTGDRVPLIDQLFRTDIQSGEE